MSVPLWTYFLNSQFWKNISKNQHTSFAPKLLGNIVFIGNFSSKKLCEKGILIVGFGGSSFVEKMSQMPLADLNKI